MRGRALPRFPIESLLGQIEGRRIFPRAGGIVAAEGALDHHQVADSALRDEFFGLCAEDGADALRTDLDDAAGGFSGFFHFEAFRRGVGHRLLALYVFAGMEGFDDDLLAPIARNCGEEAIDLLGLEKGLVLVQMWW